MTRIAIIGAGVAGPCLAAQLLQKGNFEIDIFERGTKSQDQGCGYDLNNTAREALKKGGVFDRYMEMSRPDSNYMKSYMLGGTEPILTITQPKLFYKIWGPMLETNRSKMRDVLLESIGDKVDIHFNTPVTGICKTGSESGSNRAQVLGQDDQVLGEYDLVVDTSGLSSPLRKYRISESEQDKEKWYTGVTWIHGVVNDPETSLNRSIVDKLGQGTMSVLGPKGQMFTLQRYGAAVDDHRASFYWAVNGDHAGKYPASISTQIGLPLVSKFFEDKESLTRIKDFIKSDMDSMWGEEYQNAIDSLDKVAVRPIFMHPANPNFVEDDLPLICIGDALHALPPWTGLGGNMAMHDTIDLCELITGKEGITIHGLRNLEQKLSKRAEPITIEAEERKQMVKGWEKSLEGKNEKEIREFTMSELLGNTWKVKVGLALYNFTLKLSSFLEPILPSPSL